MAEKLEVEVLPEEPTVREGKVVYESDLRAAQNGHNHTVLQEDGGDVPPEDDPEDDDEGDKPGRQPLALRLVIASAYLGFGGLMVYAGVLVLKDAWRDRRNKS